MGISSYIKEERVLAELPEELVHSEAFARELDDIELTYNAALKEITAKLEILSNNFKMMNSYVPVHHIQGRLKTFDSLMEKAGRYGIEDPLHNIPKVREQVYDIAGIRVVCNYREDIYTIADLLRAQEDVRTIKVKDYCKNPKPSGYRSLHVVVEIPVFLVDGKKMVPVEIQFRTIAMDTWATLEHDLKYKNKGALSADVKDQLQECAQTLADVDIQMERIRHQVF